MEHMIRPYGDTRDDGKVQISFTLPIPYDARGEEAAKAVALKMNVIDPTVVTGMALSDGFSFYIVYGIMTIPIDVTMLEVTEVESEAMTKEEVEAFIAHTFDRPIVVVGASTGTDAHTVGIDAIMNMKGYAGHYGLERYAGIDAYNLGGQIDNETLLEEAIAKKADVILISQTVTQKDVHIKNLTQFIELLEAENVRDDFLLIVGGPRINHKLAKELGFDAGFGQKKYAFDVASFIVEALKKKRDHDAS